MTAITVGVISFAYSLLIEHFPSGGGGYLVASSLLGPKAGVVSGSALVVDYVLTITVSICSGVDALFSFLPIAWQAYKVPADLSILVVLLVLNLRGVKESIKILVPIFLVFVATHFLLITYGILSHTWAMPQVFADSHAQMVHDSSSLGWVALLLIFMRAYSLGGGTYTGIEAVSNGLTILRGTEGGHRQADHALHGPVARVHGGRHPLLLPPLGGRTGRRQDHERRAPGTRLRWVDPLGPFRGAVARGRHAHLRGALLFVAAQAGFIDGPRVMSNMAVDSWLPHRFANLSERLVTQNGVLLWASPPGSDRLHEGAGLFPGGALRHQRLRDLLPH